MSIKVTLAFYKGKGLIGDYLIRWWTRSQYSHCELIINNTWYTSSMRDGGVRRRFSAARPSDHWDFVDVDMSVGDSLDAITKFSEILGKKYDWIGIFFSQFIKADGHERHKWFCSEVCAYMLGLDKPHRFSPQDLYRQFKTDKVLSF